jgi:hypothetical protein
MLPKRIIAALSAGASLAAATPTFADPPHWTPAHGRRSHETVIVIGAAIGSQLGHGHDRAAATAVGAVLGGVIGSGL